MKLTWPTQTAPKLGFWPYFKSSDSLPCLVVPNTEEVFSHILKLKSNCDEKDSIVVLYEPLDCWKFAGFALIVVLYSPKNWKYIFRRKIVKTIDWSPLLIGVGWKFFQNGFVRSLLNPSGQKYYLLVNWKPATVLKQKTEAKTELCQNWNRFQELATKGKMRKQILE